MPMLKACPGCRRLTKVTSKYCPSCTERRDAERKAPIEARRPNAAARGYDAEWRKLRAWFLRGNPFCVECAKHGRTMLASEVDHIRPRSEGGSDDESNLQALCKRCHSKKTSAEVNRRMRERRQAEAEREPPSFR